MTEVLRLWNGAILDYNKKNYEIFFIFFGNLVSKKEINT